MRFISLIVVLFLLLSCNNKKGIPDVSNINVDVQVQRFDKDFFSIDTNNLQVSMDQLLKKYPAFLPLYFEYLSPVNFIVQNHGRSYSEAIREYYANIKPLADAVDDKYESITEIEKGLEQNLKYVKYYYPDFKIPPVFTTVESLNPQEKTEIYGTTFYKDTLIISLQMFMGKDYVAYDPSVYFDYLRRRFEREYIVPNSLRSIANVIYPDSSEDASMIEQIIEKGKQWYLLDHFLPDTHDTLKTFFTKRQLEWCEENEGNIWTSVLTNTPDLYTLDRERIQTYLGEAPFTQNVEASNSTPGNVGQWLGWQIVKQFADKNSDISLQDVLATPAKKIFQEAKYKPK
jgi:hypothetical protein